MLEKKVIPRYRYHAARRELEPEEPSFYEASETPYRPALDVQKSATTLLLEIGTGVGSDSESPACHTWVVNLRDTIAGATWVQEESLDTNSLVNLAQRCSRMETVHRGSTFLQMVLELLFAAKINSYVHSLERFTVLTVCDLGFFTVKR